MFIHTETMCVIYNLAGYCELYCTKMVDFATPRIRNRARSLSALNSRM